MKVVIIDYAAGNTRSVWLAIKRLGVEAIVSSDIEEIKSASHVILPGVGNAGSAMKALKLSGLAKVIPLLSVPLLGICLGYQLLCRSSEEGNTEGLGVFEKEVIRFRGKIKIPHVGWSKAQSFGGELFKGLASTNWFYFVHSYMAPVSKESTSETDYGAIFSSSSEKNNFFGVQFHPEKSGEGGEALLRNFLRL